MCDGWAGGERADDGRCRGCRGHACPIAQNLSHAGFDVRVYDRTQQRAEALADGGAYVASPRPGRLRTPNSRSLC
ncbi:NAD(P)-binding domain-containing protein [Streptomyces sp. NPDC001601]|uniref:NAD(P)-binding domain-containing protein n=1 Tax=Streptomyces sp. NPDC001601 TaxID=3364592 RepID=UPI0036A3D724